MPAEFEWADFQPQNIGLSMVHHLAFCHLPAIETQQVKRRKADVGTAQVQKGVADPWLTQKVHCLRFDVRYTRGLTGKKVSA